MKNSNKDVTKIRECLPDNFRGFLACLSILVIWVGVLILCIGIRDDSIIFGIIGSVMCVGGALSAIMHIVKALRD